MKPTTLFIFGGKSTALEIAETTRLVHPNTQLIFVMGDQEERNRDNQIGISNLKKSASACSGEKRFIISMADPTLRQSALKAAVREDLQPLTLIHPQTIVSPSAIVDHGCYLAPGSVVSTESHIGPHTVLNYNITIGHHASTGEHCIINPGASIGGNVSLGNRVLVGSNSFIFQGTKVGDDCQIDALTYVRNDLPPRHLASSRQVKVFPRPDRK
jgi:sugar O-acyltransferase (sialic acid O-acetyltransferase NeuD family)